MTEEDWKRLLALTWSSSTLKVLKTLQDCNNAPTAMSYNVFLAAFRELLDSPALFRLQETEPEDDGTRRYQLCRVSEECP
jgi:hypothetical protein